MRVRGFTCLAIVAGGCDGEEVFPDLAPPDVPDGWAVVLNELDVDGNGDWIELYNGAEEAVDLTGHWLTEDASVLDQWPIPDGTTIEARSYLVFYDDQHPLGLDEAGDSLLLVGPSDDGPRALDAVVWGEAPGSGGRALARVRAPLSVWRWVDVPTPGEVNP